MKNLNYQGAIAFVKQGHLDTMRYFHQTDNEQEKEKLLSLNFSIRVVVRENERVRCFFKDIQTIVVNHQPSGGSFILNLKGGFVELNNNYAITVEEGAIITSHSTHVISK